MNSCPLKDVRVVILGQDPYHDVGQAMGLSFSVPAGKTVRRALLASMRLTSSNCAPATRLCGVIWGLALPVLGHVHLLRHSPD